MINPEQRKFRMRTLLVLFALSSVFLLTNCDVNPPRVEEQNPIAMLVATSWQAVEMSGLDTLVGSMVLRFDSESKLTVFGNDGCNAYGAEFSISPSGDLKGGPTMSTELYCGPEVEAIGRAHYQALKSARSCRMDTGDLIVCDSAGSVLIKCTRILR
jgi:heat shock protein HslJ